MKKLIFSLLICSVFISGCTDKSESAFTPLEELPSDYSLSDAKADGCVVFENSDITNGENFWDSFVEQTKRGDDAYVRYCNYYTIEDPSRYYPEYYEEIKDEYPKMYVHDLTFDGDKYTVRWFEDGTEITREYRYMLKFDEKPQSERATYTQCTRYVLVNDKDVTWDDIFRGMTSSVSCAFIDHLTVYHDYIYQDE
ncbi:MAG: hypothetical protein IJZ20_07750 [Clostridia bacterium]|nr:hypothetical protein [Clostridia bacterium]